MTAFNYGGISFPLGAADARLGMLPVADPGLRTILDFGAFCLETYLGTGLVADLSAHVTEPEKFPVTANVGMSVPVDPTVVARVSQLRFPLFAAWRKSAKYNWRTNNWRQNKSVVGCMYILPPLTSGQLHRVSSVLTAVGAILDYKFSEGFDPGYLAGQTVWTENGVASVEVTGAQFGLMPFADAKDGIGFHAWEGELEVVERVMPTTVGISDLAENTASITDGSIDPDNPIDVIDLKLPTG